LLEHGFLDAIVERKNLKNQIAFSLKAMYDAPEGARS
jgi:acetyl-CoA carboxylase beta subunit